MKGDGNSLLPFIERHVRIIFSQIAVFLQNSCNDGDFCTYIVHVNASSKIFDSDYSNSILLFVIVIFQIQPQLGFGLRRIESVLRQLSCDQCL